MVFSGNLTELLQREGALNQVRLEICSLQILRGLAYLVITLLFTHIYSLLIPFSTS